MVVNRKNSKYNMVEENNLKTKNQMVLHDDIRIVGLIVIHAIKMILVSFEIL